MPNDKQIDYFQNLDVATHMLYFNLMCNNLSQKREAFYVLLAHYNELTRLMSLNSAYYTVCTQLSDVESLLVNVGLLKSRKQIGSR